MNQSQAHTRSRATQRRVEAGASGSCDSAGARVWMPLAPRSGADELNHHMSIDDIRIDWRAGLACLSLALATTACGDDGSSTGDETGTGTETGGDMGLEIVGTYTDDFGGMHEISEDTWINGDSTFAIVEYKNQADWLVAQNGEDNEFNPGLWSRFDWAWDGDTLYYCQSVFDGATIEDALEGSADATDLEMGCGSFAWTNLTP